MSTELLVADGNLGIWAAARQVWPEAGEQRCWNHKMANVLDRLPKREQAEAKGLLRDVTYRPSKVKTRHAPWLPTPPRIVAPKANACTNGS